MPHHSEKRFVPYTPDEMFALVADVERYPEFLPWIAALRIRTREGDTFICDVLASFGALRERFTSRVALDRAASMITAEYVDGPFHHLTNRWRFVARDGGCEVEFDIDFALKSRTLEALMGGVFARAVERMTAAFDERAHRLYGKRESSQEPAKQT